MTEHNRLLARPWGFSLVVMAFLAIHLVMFHFLRNASSRLTISGTVAGGVVVLLIAKHVGLLAALLRPIRNFLRKGTRQ